MSLATRSSRFSIWLRSLTIRSISTLPMSRRGSMGPTWGMVSSSKARSTWMMASTLRRLVQERGFLQRLFADGGQVGVLHRRVDGLARVGLRGEFVQAGVGHAGDADVGLARSGRSSPSSPWSGS